MNDVPTKKRGLTIEEVPLPEGQQRSGTLSPKTLKGLHPLLPKPPFYLLMVAPSGVGKTTLLMNMICKKEYYGGKFQEDHVLVWTTTKDLDPTWSSPWLKGVVDRDNIFDSFAQDHLQEVVDHIKTEREQGEHAPYLFIFDDMITEGICSTNPWMVGMLEKLSMWGRHVGISTIILSQKYNMISKKIRLRDTIDWIIFKVSKEEEKEICEEQSGRLDKLQFQHIYQHATNQKYGFLHISGQTQDPAKKYRRNFEVYLTPPNVQVEEDKPRKKPKKDEPVDEPVDESSEEE
jgi:hypothetical protein